MSGYRFHIHKTAIFSHFNHSSRNLYVCLNCEDRDRQRVRKIHRISNFIFVSFIIYRSLNSSGLTALLTLEKKKEKKLSGASHSNFLEIQKNSMSHIKNHVLLKDICFDGVVIAAQCTATF